MPNIVLPLVSGLAIRRHGRSVVLLVAAFSVLLGQVLFAGAVSGRLSWLILAGRFVFGLGSEVLGVITYDVITESFGQVQYFERATLLSLKRRPILTENSNFHLNAALATLLTFGRLGSASVFLLLQKVVQQLGMSVAVWVVTAATVAPILCGCAYLVLHSSLHGDAEALPSLSCITRVLPRRFWALVPICMLGYACVTHLQIGCGNSSSSGFMTATSFAPVALPRMSDSPHDPPLFSFFILFWKLQKANMTLLV